MFTTLAKIIAADAKFGCPSTRMYWISTPATVDTTKKANRYVEYCNTRGLLAGVACNIVASGSMNMKQMTAIIMDAMNDSTIDVVKYRLLPSVSNSAFLFSAKICPPSPNNHSKTVINSINGSKTSIAPTASSPIYEPTKKLSMTELMFSAITISNVGNNNSLNLLSAILKFICLLLNVVSHFEKIKLNDNILAFFHFIFYCIES